MTEMAQILAAAAACRRCGACMEVCPLYQNLGQEEVVARGKLSLLQGWQAGHLPPSRRLRQILETCLLCGACAAKCPAGLAIPELVRAGRARLFQERGWDWSPALALAHLSRHSAALRPQLAVHRDLLAKLRDRLGPDRGFWFRLWPHLTGLVARLPLPAPKPFSALAPQILPGQKRGRLAFFSGCGLEIFFPDAGLAFLKLGQALGYEILIPPGQECCGLLAASAGATAIAQTLARRFVQLYSGLQADLIVTLCGSCSYHLKKLPTLLPPGPEQDLAAKLAPRVREASEFLITEPALSPMLRQTSRSPLPLAYHDPCHLRRGQNIWAEPRELLRLLPWIDWREPAGAGQCCGLGGVFGLCHPQISQDLGRQAWDIYRQGGAAVVATACSGCLLQLNSLAPPAASACHLVELLAAAV